MKIEFYTKKKTTLIRFNELIEIHKKGAFTKTGSNEKIFSKRKFYKLIRNDLHLSTNQIGRFFDNRFNKKEKKKIYGHVYRRFIAKNINYKKEIKVSQKFTKADFIFSSLRKKNIRKIEIGKEQYFFKCGVSLTFKSEGSKVFTAFNNITEETYTIPHFPISLHQPNHRAGYPTAYRNFFNLIKKKIFAFPSLWFFEILYLDLLILNLKF